MQEAIPTRQEHKNNRYAGVLPRDHDDQKPKKSFVGWDQDSSSAKDQGKNNMATERLTEKSMRKPGEDQSPVVKQEYLSNNVERDINQDDLSSKEKKDGGRSSTPYSDPSKNVVDSVARTNSPLEKEKKEMTAMRPLGNEQIKDDGKTQLYTDPPKTTHASSTVGVQSKPVSSIPLSRTQSRSDNTTFKIISAIPSVEKEKKETDPYEAEKNIGVPFSSNELADRDRNKKPTTTGRSYEETKEKKGFCDCCSIL